MRRHRHVARLAPCLICLLTLVVNVVHVPLHATGLEFGLLDQFLLHLNSWASHLAAQAAFIPVED